MTLWFFSPLDDVQAWSAALLRALPDLEIVTGYPVAAPERIEAALVYKPPPGALASLPNLAAVFSLAAGVERLLDDATLPDVPICRMVEPSLAATIADFAHAAVLRVHRGFDGFERDQRAARWAYAPPRLAADVTVAVLGLGALGKAVVSRLSGHGYRVLGWNRRGAPVLGAERVAGGADGLPGVLGEAEIVVALLPATAATRGLFDRRFFEAMRPGAHFVNLGRGDQLVGAALLAALDDGHLAGATLDVFEEEPLPSDHPFWAHPRVLVTPHVAGATLPATGAEVVAANIERLRARRPLLHVVDRGAGY